jgi:hypothetical protein
LVRPVDIQDAAEDLCRKLMNHASLVGEDSAEDAVIIAAGESFADSASAYKDIIDGRLGGDSGLFASREKYSSREMENSSEITSSALQSSDISSFLLLGKYYLRIKVSADFLLFARRHLDRNVATLEEALRLLCEKDGGNPKKYPDDLIDTAGHSISFHES